MLVDMTTHRTALAGVGRGDAEDLLTVKARLVGELRPEVVIGPADADVTVPDLHAFGLRPHALQVLQNEERPLGVRLRECLRDAVIDITHPAVLSGADALEPAPGGRRAAPLQLLTEPGVPRPLRLHGGAADERRTTAVIGRHELTDAAVDTDHADDIRTLRHVNGEGDGHMQEDTAPAVHDELRSPVPAVPQTGTDRLQPQAATERIDGEAPPHEGPVMAVYEINLRNGKTHLRPLMSVGPNGAVLRHYGLEDRLGHLGLQSKTHTDVAVEAAVQPDDGLRAGAEDEGRDGVTGVAVRTRHFEQLFELLFVGLQPDLVRYHNLR